ncbi:MAG: UDP-N-acetylmuramate dehydrogenase [Clostridiales bacterium]|nr:UDP-N-acetylmuramate dehydrogenase [Clostridiales bacterium]
MPGENIIRKGVELKALTTMKTGGPAAYLVEPSNEDEIIKLLRYAQAKSLEVFILGNGSNVIADDEGFDGLIIKLGNNMSELIVDDDPEDPDYSFITAKAGCLLSKLGNTAASEGLEGAEFACGIPGSVGGAVFMNAGAYGADISDIAVEVSYIEDFKLQTRVVSKEDFGYRTSFFAHNGRIVTSLKIRLKKGDKERINEYVRELRDKRTTSQPLTVPSCGSTFKRPEGYFAGKLIQDSGLKGFSLDDSGAQVSSKHAGFVVNNEGKAGSEDIKRLIRYIQDKVYEDSGVRLECEVRFLGGKKEQ